MIRVGVVEDHPLYREALLTSLPVTQFIVAFSVSTIGEAVRCLRDCDVDVVLVDVLLPDGDGLELPERIGTRQCLLPVFVAVTSLDDPVMVERARINGFSGFISKSTDRLKLVDVVERCHHGETVFPVVRSVDTERFQLTDRELEVLALVAEGLTNADVGEALGIGRETVKSHIVNVLRKLDAVDRAHAVAKAYRSGVLTQRPPYGG